MAIGKSTPTALAREFIIIYSYIVQNYNANIGMAINIALKSGADPINK